jgi:hypothetical protein
MLDSNRRKETLEDEPLFVEDSTDELLDEMYVDLKEKTDAFMKKVKEIPLLNENFEENKQ